MAAFVRFPNSWPTNIEPIIAILGRSWLPVGHPDSSLERVLQNYPVLVLETSPASPMGGPPMMLPEAHDPEKLLKWELQAVEAADLAICFLGPPGDCATPMSIVGYAAGRFSLHQKPEIMIVNTAMAIGPQSPIVFPGTSIYDSEEQLAQQLETWLQQRLSR